MKHNLSFKFALILILGLSLKTNAQFAFGVKAGINSSALAEIGNLYDGNSYKPGLVIGARAGYNFTDVISLSSEVNYQNKGSQASILVNGNKADAIRNINYLTVPLLVNAGFSRQLGLEPNWKIFGCFGPYYGWLIDAKDFVDNSEISNQTRIKDQIENTDWGLVFGIGASHTIKSFEIYTDIRYDMGLYEIISSNNKLRNKTIALTIGVNL